MMFAKRCYILSLCIALLVVGCRTKPQALPPTTAPTTKPVEVLKKPAIDLSRGGAGFPLDSKNAPKDVQELIDSMRRAYGERLENVDHVQIRAEGEKLRSLDLFEVDLSNSMVRANFTPQPQPSASKITPFIFTKLMRYRADPLKYQGYSASMTLEAHDADISLARGGDRKLQLALVDCSYGSAKMRIDLSDLEKSLVAGSKVRSTLAMAFESIELHLRSDGPKTLEADMTVSVRLLMVPAKFRLTGRADVDPDFNIHFTRLSAAGTDPGGAVLAAVVQAKLDKLNNRAAPLVRLPGDHIRVTDLKIRLERDLVIDVQFKGDKKQ